MFHLRNYLADLNIITQCSVVVHITVSSVMLCLAISENGCFRALRNKTLLQLSSKLYAFNKRSYFIKNGFFFFAIFMLSAVIVHSYNWYLIRSWNQVSVRPIPMLVAIISVTGNQEHLHSTAHKPTYESN
jgi:hypothetical protein